MKNAFPNVVERGIQCRKLKLKIIGRVTLNFINVPTDKLTLTKRKSNKMLLEYIREWCWREIEEGVGPFRGNLVWISD